MTRRRLIISWFSSETLSQQFELCGVNESSFVAVLTDDLSSDSLKSKAQSGLELLGCKYDFFNIQWDQKTTILTNLQSEGISNGLSQADLVINLAMNFSDEIIQQSLLAEKLLLSISDSRFEPYSHSVTSAGIIQRSNRIKALLPNTEVISVLSETGTNLQFATENLVSRSHIGVPRETGLNTKWPSGSVELFPFIEKLDGEIVLMPGDIVDNAVHIVKSPVVFQIRGGNIVDIAGESSEVNLLKAQLESFADRDCAYSIKSLAIGLLFFRDDLFSGPFDPEKTLAIDRYLRGGWVTITSGSETSDSLSVTLTTANVAFDNVEILVGGNFAATLEPDIYELALMGL